ncbi:tyrosine-type recombinase/integrase [Microbacterium sp. NPDC090281]|uniref:tyrosine-type recombinase/integrase n=1 Tax=Microbacterium sp. NPDC090281 TaxID=3364208 RepID=UPI00380F97A4
MTDETLPTAQWLLASAGGSSGVAPELHPLATEWQDIAARERRLGIPPGQPILMSSEQIDYRLGDYFRTAFRMDQSSTAQTYATELRTWFNFLDARGRGRWDDVDHRAVREFQIWRLYDEDNPRPITPATWNKGWEALNHFYRWATREGFMESNPILDSQRLKDPGRTGGHREKNARSSRDRWLTPIEYALWRDVGFRGYDAARDESGNLVPTRPATNSRSRNTARNTAFADFGLTTGLRRAEAASLLCIELPSTIDDETPLIGKGNIFRHYRVVHELGIESLNDYLRGERRDAIRRGRKMGRFAPKPEHVIVEIMHSRRGQRLRFADGRVHDLPGLPGEVRRRLLIEGPDGFEPAWLWLGDSGETLLPQSWSDVFQSANRRVTLARAKNGVRSPWVTVTPHSLRFTFALFVLLAGVRAIDEDLGLSSASAFSLRNYSQAFDEVRDLLGHSTTAVTRKHYLAPVKSLRSTSVLRSTSLTEMWDELRASSRLVGFDGDR